MKAIRKDTIFGKRNDRSTRRATKIMFLYFKYMFEILLEKKSFEIKNFGTLKINKTNMVQKDLKLTPRYYKGNTYFFNSNALNKNMINELVSVVFIRNPKFNTKVRFQSCKSFRKKLTDLLFHTDFGKTIELCQ